MFGSLGRGVEDCCGGCCGDGGGRTVVVSGGEGRLVMSYRGTRVN